MKKHNEQPLDKLEKPEKEMEPIDTNQAWESFKRKVQNEPVPPFWSQPDTSLTRVKPPAIGSLTQPGEAGYMKPQTPHSSPQLYPGMHLHSEGVITPVRKTRSLRKWTAAVVAAAVAGTILFTPIGSDALASLLHTFRLQHLNTVSISTDDLNRLNQSLSQGSVDVAKFDFSQYGKVSQQGGGAIRTVSAAEAAQLAGYPLKMLPGQSAASTDVEIQPPLKLVFELQSAPINKLLTQLGGKSKLPGSVDGKPIAIEIPTMIHLSTKNGTTSKNLFQLQAPSLNVPDGVDLDKVREAILDLPLLPEDLRTKLEGIEDWRHTLPIPAFEGSSVQISVSGREAVLSSAGSARTLIWLDNGRVFRLSGSTADYPSDNAILADAKEIINQ